MICDNIPDSYRSCDCDVCVEADDPAEDMMTRAIAESMAKGQAAILHPTTCVSAMRLASAFRALGFSVGPGAKGGYIATVRTVWQVEICPT